MEKIGSSYEIRGVIPPDEAAGGVNNSVFTNYIAALSLEIAIELSAFLPDPPSIPPHWQDIIS